MTGRLVWIVGACVLLTAGCEKPPEHAEVTGVVTRGGKPLADIKVTFTPDAEAGTGVAGSWAITDADGRYRLLSDRGPNGAMVGKHRVCLADLENGADPDGPDGPEQPRADGVGESPQSAPAGSTRRKPSRVPRDYYEFSRTPLRGVQVCPDPTVYDIDVGKSGSR